MAFIVPNALDVTDSIRQAEPDAGDWKTVGSRRSGVFSGLNVTEGAGMSVSVAAGRYTLNGVNYELASPANVPLTNGGSQPRFDIVGLTTSGPTVINGTASDDPVFPLYNDGDDETFLPLAAVYVDVADSNVVNDMIVDKRVLLMDGARGAAAAADTFLHNESDDADFSVSGEGLFDWGSLVRLVPNGNKVTFDTGDVEVDNDLYVNGTLYGATGEFSGDITSDNIRKGPGAPSNGDGNNGDIFQSELGVLYVKRANSWEEIYADEYPVGTIIANVQDPTTFLDDNPTWAHCGASAQVVDRNQESNKYERLVDKVTAWAVVPNVSVRIPSGVEAALISGANPNALASDVVGSNYHQLSEAELPRHKHLSGGTTQAGGSHSHPLTIQNGGSHSHSMSNSGNHSHPVSDPGHRHNGMNPYDNDVATYFCGAVWGGNNKLDAHFSDASHTWTVDMSISTIKAVTGITIPSSGAHVHNMSSSGSHSHAASITGAGSHTHALPTETEVGSDQSFDKRPKHLEVNFYVKL